MVSEPKKQKVITLSEVRSVLKSMNEHGISAGLLAGAFLMYVITIHAAGLAIMLLMFMYVPSPPASLDKMHELIAELGYITMTTLTIGFVFLYLSLRDWKSAPWRQNFSA